MIMSPADATAEAVRQAMRRFLEKINDRTNV